MKNLHNKVVLLTGAASGIGRCMAHEFATQGAKLILTDMNRKGLEETVTLYHIENQVLGLIECNLLDPDASEKIVEQALKLSPTIDVFYSNAGYMIMGKYLNLTQADVDTLRTINLDVPMKLTRLLLPQMIHRNEGAIGFTCSSSATATPPGAAAYGMSKAGLAAFAEALNAEVYRHNIHVSRICPGYVKTNLLQTAQYRDAQSKQRSQSVPEFFGSTPEKVARISVNAIRKKKAFVIIGLDEHIKYFLKNHFHFVYVQLNRLMAKLLLDD